MNTKQKAQPESGLPKLGGPAEHALAGAGIRRLEQLTRFSENETRQLLHGVGPNALGKLNAALAARGISFSQSKGIE